MFKWVTITVLAIITAAVLIYWYAFYMPLYHIQKYENASVFDELDPGNVSYIITTRMSGNISMKELDSITSVNNYSFTRTNMKDSLRHIPAAARL